MIFLVFFYVSFWTADRCMLAKILCFAVDSLLCCCAPMNRRAFTLRPSVVIVIVIVIIVMVVIVILDIYYSYYDEYFGVCFDLLYGWWVYL